MTLFKFKRRLHCYVNYYYGISVSQVVEDVLPVSYVIIFDVYSLLHSFDILLYLFCVLVVDYIKLIPRYQLFLKPLKAARLHSWS